VPRHSHIKLYMASAAGVSITVTTEDEKLFPLSLSVDDTIETVKAIVSVEVIYTYTFVARAKYIA
jgi:hypothetical protein